MTSGFNKVNTSVHPIIHHLGPIHTVLLLKISIETSFNISQNWFPTFILLISIHSKRFHRGGGRGGGDVRFIVIDEITITRSIHHGQSQSDSILLNIFHLLISLFIPSQGEDKGGD